MTRRRTGFASTPQDPRCLSMLPHEIGRQSVGERRRIHGPILPMAPARAMRLDLATILLGAAVSAFCLLYFGLQFARPLLERMF